MKGWRKSWGGRPQGMSAGRALRHPLLLSHLGCSSRGRVLLLPLHFPTIKIVRAVWNLTHQGSQTPPTHGRDLSLGKFLCTKGHSHCPSTLLEVCCASPSFLLIMRVWQEYGITCKKLLFLYGSSDWDGANGVEWNNMQGLCSVVFTSERCTAILHNNVHRMCPTINVWDSKKMRGPLKVLLISLYCFAVPPSTINHCLWHLQNGDRHKTLPQH